MPQKTVRKTRITRTYEFGPHRDDPAPETGPVTLFALRCTTEEQETDLRRSGGWATVSRDTADLAPGGLTRRQVQALGESALDWLAYLGEDPLPGTPAQGGTGNQGGTGA